jgi:hypothetical protein
MNASSTPSVDTRRSICFYAFMRTTVDLPTPLFRRAKARAASRGETLRTLITRAVTAEIGGRAEHADPTRRRVQLPLIGTPDGRPKVRLTNADIERILTDEEARHYGLLRRPPRRPR